jgi:hypothetical protein
MITAAGFRKIALGLPEAVESFHMNHPDFRVGGKVFATLGYPEAGWGMVRLAPDKQRELVAAEPDAFVPVKGAWGRRGATSVHLRAVRIDALREALKSAWMNAAPKRLL